MDSYPALYSPTGYGIHDGEAVVQTPHTVKTLQGPETEAIVGLLAQIDGDTPAGELVQQVPGATVEQIELLYEAALSYNAAAIPTGLRAEGCGQLLEPALSSISPARHPELPERLDSLSVAVFGHQESISPVVSRLRAAGVSVDETAKEPDVVFLSEHLERSESWTAANEQWAASEATLVKSRLTETGWRLGPVLSASAPACLNCLYNRVDANRAGGQLFDETGGGDPPHLRAYTDTLTELLFGVLLGSVPRYLDEQLVVYDHYSQRTETPRVFGLPHCEVCNV